MDPLPLSQIDEVMLKKRMLIETVINELKSQTQVEQARQRSFVNFEVKVVFALIAYMYLEKEPLAEPELSPFISAAKTQPQYTQKSDKTTVLLTTRCPLTPNIA